MSYSQLHQEINDTNNKASKLLAAGSEREAILVLHDAFALLAKVCQLSAPVAGCDDNDGCCKCGKEAAPVTQWHEINPGPASHRSLVVPLSNSTEKDDGSGLPQSSSNSFFVYTK
jgi:hypothetical protein